MYIYVFVHIHIKRHSVAELNEIGVHVCMLLYVIYVLCVAVYVLYTCMLYMYYVCKYMCYIQRGAVRRHYVAGLNEIGDDVYLEYYIGKGFHINYSCLHFLRKTHKLVQ
jgi:hypothetical protein